MATPISIPKTALPEGFIARPPALDDIEAFVAMANASARDVIGNDEHTVEESRIEWQDPSFNLETDARLVTTARGDIAGGVEVWSRPPHVRYWFWGRVHPAYRGQGIGAFLLEWAEARARQAVHKAPQGARVTAYVSTISSHDAATQLFDRKGFRPVRHFWTMAIDFDGPPPEPDWPPGITVRTMVPGQDERAVYLALDEAFRDHWGHVDTPLEAGLAQWLHRLENDEDFDPTLYFLAMDGDEIAGMSLCRPKITEFPGMGWVDELGVRRPWRRRGLALALLRHSFGEFYRRGRRQVGLGVDAASLTGATRLYEKAGMRPIRQYDGYEKELRPGLDLSTQAVEG
ncbi:MAG: GNAT family N-acetyltransferase [Anaerolineae bacterium]